MSAILAIMIAGIPDSPAVRQFSPLDAGIIGRVVFSPVTPAPIGAQPRIDLTDFGLDLDQALLQLDGMMKRSNIGAE